MFLKMTKRDLVVSSTRHHLAHLLKYYPRRPCALSFVKSRILRPQERHFLLFQQIFFIFVCIHAGNPRVPLRVLASGPKPYGGNYELQRLFRSLRNTNGHDHGQAVAFRFTQVAARGGKRRRQKLRVNECSMRAKKPVCRDIVLIPNPKLDKVSTHNARLELERKGFVIHEFPFDKE